MNHFFVSPSAIQGDSILFPADVSAQITRVLRLQIGDVVLVLDDLGSAFEVQLESLSAKECQGSVIRQYPAENEPKTNLVLLVGLTQREKFEWILQKGTELGVSAFMPVVTSRTLIQKIEEVSQKTERWQRILKEAAEQCERGRVPKLLAPMLLKNALLQKPLQFNLVLNVDEAHLSLKQALNKNPAASSIQMLIGPEGGFSSEEIGLAQHAGYTSVTLGPRILRMETAALVAAAVVMAEKGELG